MSAISEPTRSSIIVRLLDYTETNWPRLAKVRARYHGSFADITGVLRNGGQIPLFRLRYGGQIPLFRLRYGGQIPLFRLRYGGQIPLFRLRYGGSAHSLASRATPPPATATKTRSCSPDSRPVPRKKPSTPPVSSTSSASDTDRRRINGATHLSGAGVA